MDELKNKWKKARESAALPPQNIEALVASARQKKKNNLYFHYGNIIILSITLVGISLFFYYVAPFRELLSRTGVALMVGGLIIRIVIEIFSVLKSKKIRMVNDAASTTSDTLEFYRFRKKIHGPVTITIVALYCLGFVMLGPEFSRYIAPEWIVLMYGSFVLGALLLIWQIRKGIQKEMRILLELAELRKEMQSGI
ncbi:membrane protein [Flammeovirgaceae bacterium 311]|nr:membrane protein [Flammeovirgaceae bacterium 311]